MNNSKENIPSEIQAMRNRRVDRYSKTVTVYDNNILEHIDLSTMTLHEIDELITILSKIRNIFTDSRYMRFEDFDLEPIFHGDVTEVGLPETQRIFFISRQALLTTSSKLTNEIFIDDDRYSTYMWDMIHEPLSKVTGTIFFPCGLFHANEHDLDILVVKMCAANKEEVLNYLKNHRNEIIIAHENFMAKKYDM